MNNQNKIKFKNNHPKQKHKYINFIFLQILTPKNVLMKLKPKFTDKNTSKNKLLIKR